MAIHHSRRYAHKNSRPQFPRALTLPLLSLGQQAEGQSAALPRVEKPYSSPTKDQILANAALRRTINTLMGMKEFDACLSLLENNRSEPYYLDSLQRSLVTGRKIQLLRHDPQRARKLVFSEDTLAAATGIQERLQEALGAAPDKLDPDFFKKLNTDIAQIDSMLEVLALVDFDLTKRGSSFAGYLTNILAKQSDAAGYEGRIREMHATLQSLSNAKSAAGQQ